MANDDQTELDSNDVNAWHQLWNNLYHLHYRVYFDELCVEHSLNVWKRFDALFKFLQFSTASGSAVAGWSLWQQDGGRYVWVCLAGLAVLFSGIHVVLGITDKIKEDALNYSEFRGVRMHCERLQSYIQIKAYERLADYKRDYIDLSKQFETVTANKKPDFLFSLKTKEKIQAKLNKSLGL